jgi:hypothetical protein
LGYRALRVSAHKSEK